MYDFSRLPGVPVLVTCTYRDEDLPWSDPVPAGELTPAQEKLWQKIFAVSQGGKVLTAHNARKLEILEGENPSMPTLRRTDMYDFVKALHRRFPGELLILSNGEYGTAGGRPHHHMLVGLREGSLDSSEGRRYLEAMADGWWHGFIHFRPAMNSKALAYVVKDTQKGSWLRDYYIAENREPPKVYWPRKPYIGQGMEADIRSALVRLKAKYPCPLMRELAIQRDGAGKHFELLYDGRRKARRRFSETAIRKVMAEGLGDGSRDPVSAGSVSKILDFVAWDAHAETVFGDSRYRPDMAAKKERELQNAKVRSDITKRRHEEILRRKRGRVRTDPNA